MVDALHHVIDHKETIDELWRLLTPGGTMVVEEPDVRTFGVKLIAIAEKLALMRSHFLSPPRISMLFDYPDAVVDVQTQSPIAYIVAKKQTRAG